MDTDTGIYIDMHSSMVMAPFQQNIQHIGMLERFLFTTISVRLVSELLIVELYIISYVSIFVYIDWSNIHEHPTD
jgi:uncharacterized metal-binding protein